MIYILGRNDCYDCSDLEEIVTMASTEISDVLEYLYNKTNLKHLRNYSILVIEENGSASCLLYPSDILYEDFIEYTPSIFLEKENEAEFFSVKNQLCVWCDAVKNRKEEIAERERRIREFEIEKQERKLYEELKAKYGE